MLCSANPIVGIRYECPKCENFSICEKCERSYDHEHNLIKIKRIEEKGVDKKIQPCMKKLYEKFFNHEGLAEKKESEKKEVKEVKEESERFTKYANFLLNLPENYRIGFLI